MRYRPKWSQIRPSKTKVTSDQTEPDWFFLWSDYSVLKAPCALKVRSKTSSDQTIVRSNVTPCSDYCALEYAWPARPTGARKRLWADWSALKIASDQTQVSSKLPMTSLLCVRNCLWPDWRGLEDASDHTEVRSKQPLIRPKCAQNYL